MRLLWNLVFYSLILRKLYTWSLIRVFIVTVVFRWTNSNRWQFITVLHKGSKGIRRIHRESEKINTKDAQRGYKSKGSPGAVKGANIPPWKARRYCSGGEFMAVNGGGGLRWWPRRYRRSRTRQYLVSHVDWPQHRSNNDARLDVSPSPSSRTWRTASGGGCHRSSCDHHMENNVLSLNFPSGGIRDVTST